MKFTADASLYLFVQKGELQHVWQKAYEENIASSFEAMVPFLPDRCSRILDIGGGMSGISIPLSRHFPGSVVTVLDGKDDMPKMREQDQTFSSSTAAREFLEANGVNCDFQVAGKYDLVLSLRAWCFHIAVQAYKETVSVHTYSNARAIVDVRRGTEPPFPIIGVISENDKCRRLAMRL